MKKTITCFLFYHTDNQFNKLLNSLLSHPYIDQIYRGYQNIDKRLNGIGARITRL